ncbi:MAG: hypothetical protein JWN84_3610 [Nocardioides sp.]|nr:hypothetical protein [Nocardioides sp.]
MTSRARRLVAATASTVLLGLAVTACSANSDDESGGSSSADAGSAEGSLPMEEQAAAEVPAAAADQDRAGAGGDSSLSAFAAADSVTAAESGGQAAPPDRLEVDPDPRSLIKKGNVALRSEDVEDTLFEIGKVLQRTNGEVAQNDTQADDEGEPEQALLTVRVPVEEFTTAITALESLGTESEGVDLITSSQNTSDVSTEVIDVDVRVALQRRSIDRISILLERASSIRDIVSIERELARREADLGSLQKRQTFLADQTSRSTITISVERPEIKAAQREKEKDDDGFGAGLSNGWDAFKSVTTGLLTATGALLPFAIVLLVLAVPARILLRRRQPAIDLRSSRTPDSA